MTARFFANLSLVANLVSALIALAVLFGWDITEDQIAGIMLAVNSVLALLSAWFSPSIPGGGPAPDTT